MQLLHDPLRWDTDSADKQGDLFPVAVTTSKNNVLDVHLDSGKKYNVLNADVN